MINRFMFIGYGSVKNASSYQGTDLIHIFEFEDKSFLYLESENETPDVSKLPCDGLKPFPDGKGFLHKRKVIRYRKVKEESAEKNTQLKEGV